MAASILCPDLVLCLAGDLVGGVLSCAAVLENCAGLVPEQADGVLSSAAVPRVGLGPTPPPLCRCAEYTANQLSQTWWAINRCLLTHHVRSLGAWCGQRSGIKEEPAGRRTAAEMFTPSAKACTEQALKPR